MNLTIDYQLMELGWAKCTISDESASCTVTASYLSDALGNLLLSACAALRFFSRITFSFDEEPGEYRWVISSPRLNEIETRIFEFSQSCSDAPDSDGKLLFSTKCLPLTYAQAVHRAAENLLKRHGEAGYLEKWSEDPFPTGQFQELERLLALAH